VQTKYADGESRQRSRNTARRGRALARRRRLAVFAACAIPLSIALGLPAAAERIENKVAVFSGLDKVTARISTFAIEIGKPVAFGALKVTPRACYSRPSTELPKTTTFVEVDEIQLDGTEKRIFTGWMFAESPSLHSVEHPTIDVWLTNCQKPTRATAERAKPKDPIGDVIGGESEPSSEPQAEDLSDVPRRRVRR
jgi:hypothetical protein